MDGVRPNPAHFPLLTESGAAMLTFLTEHPAAPIFRNQSGNRLIQEDVSWLKQREQEIASAQLPQSTALPDWLPAFIEFAYKNAPLYRSRGEAPANFSSVPTISRKDLSRDITRIVPDELSLERLIEYSTSGTTGHPLKLPSHPRIAAQYLYYHKRALRHQGIELTAGRGDVSVVLVGHQKRCFTYVSVTPSMQDAGLVKLNLHPNDWRDPNDRVRYLDSLKAELYTGDPLSLEALAQLPLKHSPRAILSTSMAMTTAFRTFLEKRFQCPVLDLYSMNECGPIAAYQNNLDGHLVLQEKLHVEILSPEGIPMPPGQRGEITLTGGFNFYLPLLRYRTGDYASLEYSESGPVLKGLSGRPPVNFRTGDGAWINNVDVTHCMARFALPQYGLHQCADGSLRLKLRANQLDQRTAIHLALNKLFGQGVSITDELIAAEDKIIQYSSDLISLN